MGFYYYKKYFELFLPAKKKPASGVLSLSLHYQGIHFLVKNKLIYTKSGLFEIIFILYINKRRTKKCKSI
jgi:uncharacterized membrane protein